MYDNNIDLPSFRQGASFADSKGNLYVGGLGGFIRISPNPLATKKESPKIHISDVQVNGVSLFTNDTNDQGNTFKAFKIKPDATNIRIFFSTLNYDGTRNVHYAYKLDGVDKDWNVLKDGTHDAFYNRLGKGTYKLHIKTLDESDCLSKEETIVMIERLPAIYETWYAYLLYVLLTVAAVYHGKGFLRKYKEHKQREKERKHILELQIASMKRTEEERRKNLDNSLAIPIVAKEYETSDKKFVSDAILSVERNLSNPDYKLENMAVELNVSRSTLNRRLKTLCGITPLDLIRNVRLKYACDMLSRDEKISVSEVAYSTGFSTPRYFSKCFKEQFGIIPSDYQIQKHKGDAHTPDAKTEATHTTII